MKEKEKFLLEMHVTHSAIQALSGTCQSLREAEQFMKELRMSGFTMKEKIWDPEMKSCGWEAVTACVLGRGSPRQ